MADRVYWGAFSKKISTACEKSVAAAGSGEVGRQEEQSVQDSSIVKSYFGNELLYVCYEFYDRFKNKPSNWPEVFDFLRFIKVKNVCREIAAEAAKAGQNG
jgi:hypothetical protein